MRHNVLGVRLTKKQVPAEFTCRTSYVERNMLHGRFSRHPFKSPSFEDSLLTSIRIKRKPTRQLEWMSQ